MADIIKPAAYCQNCIHLTTCKITQKIASMDMVAGQFNEDNANFPLKMKIVGITYDCANKTIA